MVVRPKWVLSRLILTYYLPTTIAVTVCSINIEMVINVYIILFEQIFKYECIYLKHMFQTVFKHNNLSPINVFKYDLSLKNHVILKGPMQQQVMEKNTNTNT